ncbi:hypothetical protein [Dokdonia sinensis]|uniref:hypothetical protein n=1 Tax=Dokdonia sinensis TaxID=2479847 RepID=UPI001374B505|nr:hypothetical protein [Dokdonia sinensis]
MSRQLFLFVTKRLKLSPLLPDGRQVRESGVLNIIDKQTVNQQYKTNVLFYSHLEL